jgi:hypothetical protein
VKRTLAVVLLCAGALSGCGGKQSAPTTITAIGQKPAAKATTPSALRSLSRSLGHPIYWARPQEGRTYELTRTSDGRIFVRYLPPGVPVGAPQALFTIVATYPVHDALGVLKKMAMKRGEASFKAPHEGLAVYDRAHPTNVYLAYPGSNVQIEVFDPSSRRARLLVASGRIVSVG